MKLILLEKVLNLGDLGETVNVKSGYGRNFLVPQGKAVPATRENVAMFEARRTELEAAANEKLATAESRRDALGDVVISLTVHASDEGKLFGSIGPREVAIAVSDLGHPLQKSEVIMGEGPIRYTGEHDVLIQLHADVETTVKVIVEADAQPGAQPTAELATEVPAEPIAEPVAESSDEPTGEPSTEAAAE